MPPASNDQPLIAWARLYDGRLWHVVTDPWLTACHKLLPVGDEPRKPELIATAPPANGQVCDRCVRVVSDIAHLARQAWLQDPRRRPGDTLPAPDSDEAAEAEFRANTIRADVTGGEV